MVEKKLNKLSVSKSAGPDVFHPRVLKELSRAIKVPLQIIFSKSIMEGTQPEAWKDAHIYNTDPQERITDIQRTL